MLGKEVWFIIIAIWICSFLCGINNYLATHTINPIEAKQKGLILVIPSDPETAKKWHKLYDGRH